MEILNSGLIESDDQLIQLADRYGRLVVPIENDDLDLTHWWVVKDEDAEILSVCTPDTFTTYIRERNGGVQ